MTHHDSADSAARAAFKAYSGASAAWEVLPEAEKQRWRLAARAAIHAADAQAAKAGRAQTWG